MGDRCNTVADLEQRIAPTQHMINAITDMLWHATPQDVDDGLAWYDLALAEARRLDGADGRTGAGVIAALSPLAPWGKNVERARLAFQRGTAEGLTFGSHARKADRILQGEDPDGVLGGRKVRSFYACILGDDGAVCIDRHALDVALRKQTTDTEKKVLELKGGYEHVAAAYREAAQWARMPPRCLQAVTWVAHRRRKGLDWADG